MLKNGLNKIGADRRDNSLLHTLHAYGSAVDPKGLPDIFTIYDGRPIPNQDDVDTRFNPQLPPIPVGCTGETGSFESGLQDGVLYDPLYLYVATPPNDRTTGRDIRTMLGTLKKGNVLLKVDGTFGPARGDYFNCYGKGNIDDFDAARIALWINQALKRGVYIGSWFYPQFVGSAVAASGSVGLPSFNTNDATLHCYLQTGWRTTNGVLEGEYITWQGPKVGWSGRIYMTREIYNALMQQPWTGAFTIAKIGDGDAVTIGWQAAVDHLVYFILNLIPKKLVMPTPPPPNKPVPVPVSPPAPLSFATPHDAFHSTRVMCDSAGLTVSQKDLLCACVYQESRFLANPKPNQNKDPKTGVVWSTDYGIVQVNDHFHIGAGKDFPTVQYVLNNPDECIAWMIGIYKNTGTLQPWSSYTSGAYKQWLASDSPMWQL